MIQRTKWLILVGLAVISFVFGYVIAYVKILPSGNSLVSVGPNTYQAGWDAAKKRLSEGGAVPGAGMNIEIKSLSGEIKEINGDKITLKIRPLEPLADSSLDTRTIVVDANTKLFSMQPKDQKEFMAEMEAYQKKMKANISTAPLTAGGKADTSTPPAAPAAPITPPDGFNKTAISISDLKVGQNVNVTADKNIKDVQEFTVLEITYYAPMTSVAPLTPATTNLPVPPAPININIPAPVITPVK